MWRFNAEILHSLPDDGPEGGGADRTVRSAPSDKEVSARTVWSRILEVLNYGFTYFVLQRKLLRPAALRAPNSEGFVPPIEIIQREMNDFAGP